MLIGFTIALFIGTIFSLTCQLIRRSIELQTIIFQHTTDISLAVGKNYLINQRTSVFKRYICRIIGLEFSRVPKTIFVFNVKKLKRFERGSVINTLVH